MRKQIEMAGLAVLDYVLNIVQGPWQRGEPQFLNLSYKVFVLIILEPAVVGIPEYCPKAE